MMSFHNFLLSILYLLFFIQCNPHLPTGLKKSGILSGPFNFHSQRFYYFTSIVIEKNSLPDELMKFEIRDTFNLLYAKDFDPNTREYVTHTQDVDKMELPNLLMELSQLYFEQLGEKKEEKKSEDAPKEVELKEVYQCTRCLTIYDERFGDETQNVPAGTSFSALPEEYTCSVCDAAVASFEKKVVKEVKQ
jgi:rubredoxin